VYKIKTHVLCSMSFLLFSENRAFYDIMWKNMIDTQCHNVALTRYLLDKQGYTHARSRTHRSTFPGTRKHAHTHTDKYITFISYSRQQLFANATQYYVIRNIACLFHSVLRRDACCGDSNVQSRKFDLLLYFFKKINLNTEF
jgi:hypothetical protein